MDVLKGYLSTIDSEQLHTAISTELKNYRKNVFSSVLNSGNHFRQSSKFLQRKIDLFKKEPLIVANALMIIHLLGYCDYLAKKNDSQLLPALDKLIAPELKQKMRDLFPNEIQSVCSNIKENFEKINLMSAIGGPMVEKSQDWIEGLHARLIEENSYSTKNVK